MHAKWTKLTVLMFGAGLGLSQLAASANTEPAKQDAQQDKAQEKPSLSVPYEEIEINGKKLPLTVDTLANLERYNQESELVEKVKRVLGKPDQDKARSASRPSSSTGKSDEAEVKPKVPVTKPHTLLSVFGIPGQMVAEVYVSDGEVRQLRVGEVYRGFLVKEISVEGMRVGRAGLPRHAGWVEVGSIVSSRFVHTSSRN
ncbi:MAG: hypothetical protein R3194_05805 [Limnobacter sp.]|nr:hypothetical protein [Limnobacter sp.]